MAKITQIHGEKRDTSIVAWAVAFQNAAGGPTNTAMLQAWETWIMSESGSTIYMNNPLNLTCSKGDGCYTGQVGWYQFPGNSRKFAAFSSRQTGAQAIIDLLARAPASYGYNKILSAAKAGNYVQFLTSVANSAWVNGTSGKPGYGGAANLLKRWQNLSGQTASNALVKLLSLTPEQFTQIMKDAGITSNTDTITSESFDAFIAAFQDSTGIKFDKASVTTLKSQYVGKKWSDLITGETGFTPTPAFDWQSALGTSVDILARIADPKNWIQIFGLLLGLGLTYVGFRSLMEATSAPT